MTSYHYFGKSYYYFGNEDERIPNDVTDLFVHPHVQSIPKETCIDFGLLLRVDFNGSALRTIGMAAFHGCISLMEIAIPPSVTMIEDYACQDCWSLTQVHFAEDGLLTAIGIEAFFGCESLSEVSIPSSVETIGRFAFARCQSLARVVLQEGLKAIDLGAFMECVKLEKVDIPKTLEVLGSSAFLRCIALQEVNIEEGSLRVIGHRAFGRCFKLQTIRIPSTVERVESETFTLCESLRMMKFQNGLRYLGDSSFHGCQNLQAVALPKSVTVICRFAFQECRKLVSVELGDGPLTMTIYGDAFRDCTSLINICLPSESRNTQPIPDYVQSGDVDVNSFRYCTALENQYDDTEIPLAITSRFENFPVHKRCYYATVTSANELAQEIALAMQVSHKNTLDHVVDPFGMTPFHILLSGANCRLDLLHVLLDAYPPNSLAWKDVNGKTAIEYYSQRSVHLTDQSRPILLAALQGWMVDSISSWNGLEAWKSDMSTRVNAIVAEDDVEHRQSLFQEAMTALSRYELMEATALLELSLWKCEMKFPPIASTENASRTTAINDDRGAYRIRSGVSVIIPGVVSFLFETTSAA